MKIWSRLTYLIGFVISALITSLSTNETTFYKAHSGTVKTLEYLINTTYFLTGGEDRTIKVWNYESGVLERTIYTDYVSQIQYIPKTDMVIVSTLDKKLRIGNIRTGDLNKTYTKYHQIFISFTSFQRENCYYVAGGSKDGRIIVGDTKNGTEMGRFEDYPSTLMINSVSYLKKYDCIVSAQGKHIKLGNLTSRLPTKLTEHTSDVTDFQFEESLNILISISLDKKVILWNLDKMEMIRSGSSLRELNCITTVPGKNITFLGTTQSILEVWNLTSLSYMFSRPALKTINSIEIIPEKMSILTADEKVTMGDYSLLVLQEKQYLEISKEFCNHVSSIRGIDYYEIKSPTNYYRIASIAEIPDKSIKVWNIGENSNLYTNQIREYGTFIVSIKKGLFLALGYEDGNVEIINARTGEVLKTYQILEDKLFFIDFLEKENSLLFAGKSPNIWIYKLDVTGALSKSETMQTPLSEISGVTFSSVQPLFYVWDGFSGLYLLNRTNLRTVSSLYNSLGKIIGIHTSYGPNLYIFKEVGFTVWDPFLNQTRELSYAGVFSISTFCYIAPPSFFAFAAIIQQPFFLESQLIISNVEGGYSNITISLGEKRNEIYTVKYISNTSLLFSGFDNGSISIWDLNTLSQWDMHHISDFVFPERISNRQVLMTALFVVLLWIIIIIVVILYICFHLKPLKKKQTAHAQELVTE